MRALGPPTMKPPSEKLAAKKEEQVAPEISEFCRLLAKVLRRSCQAAEPTADGASLRGPGDGAIPGSAGQRASKATHTLRVDYGVNLDGPCQAEHGIGTGEPSRAPPDGGGCPRHRRFAVPPPDNADRRKTDPPYSTSLCPRRNAGSLVSVAAQPSLTGSSSESRPMR